MCGRGRPPVVTGERSRSVRRTRRERRGGITRRASLFSATPNCHRRKRVEEKRGFIVPVGGAEEKIGDVAILRRFATLCGGAELPDRHHPHRLAAERYRQPLRGAVPQPGREARRSRSRSRAGPTASTGSGSTCSTQVDGVFLTGGNQLRLSTMIGGTEVAKALRRRNAEGMHVAGTSAGRRVPLRAHDRLRQGRARRRGPRSSPWRRASASPTG